MPLLLHGQPLPAGLRGTELLSRVMQNEGVRTRTYTFRDTVALDLAVATPCQQVGVLQREYATICSRFISSAAVGEEKGRRSVVSTSATTCCILAVISETGGHTAATLAHHDGCGSLLADGIVPQWLARHESLLLPADAERVALAAAGSQGIAACITDETAIHSAHDGRMMKHKLYVVGGFTDCEGTSEEVVCAVLDAFHGQPGALVELEVASTCNLNNRSLDAAARWRPIRHHRDDGNRPVLTNMAVVVGGDGSFDVRHVRLPVSGMHAPAELLRLSRMFTNEGLECFYHTEDDTFGVRPFSQPFLVGKGDAAAWFSSPLTSRLRGGGGGGVKVQAGGSSVIDAMLQSVQNP